MQTTTDNGRELTAPIDKSIAAEASSAHARINVPLNLDNWKALQPETQEALLWFHQHILDEGLSWDQASQALDYERSVVFKVLKGNYEGSWQNVVAAIRSYRKLAENRGTITQSEFAQNRISKMVFAGLDYALANNSITMIVGESRSGKSIAARAWQQENNHGRSVFVTAPPIGGAKSLVRQVARAVGVNRSQDLAGMVEGVYRAFNRNRILIVDEAHRCLPSDSRTCNPALLEFLRDLHDQTGCALALISTKRLPDRLERGTYQYEQLVGRIGMPILLPKKFVADDVMPILRQFLPRASVSLTREMVEIANKPGRLGIVTETLKVASRMARKASKPMSEEFVSKAIALRAQMSGNGEGDAAR